MICNGDVRRRLVCLFSLAGLFVSRMAMADVTVAKGDDWEFFTQGRIGAFINSNSGDAYPLALKKVPGESTIVPGGGLDTETNVMPRTDAMGNALQGTFRSIRLRSGFVPNVLGLGMRWRLSEVTTLKVFVGLWMTIEAEGQRKFNNPYAFAREGYAKLEGRWGSLLVGRALDLFSRGATENDFLYGHGYALGFPGNVNNAGPTAGMIGFGVLAAFFSPGIVYATPVLGGLQLSIGAYDPVVVTGRFPDTQEPLGESELTYDYARGVFKLHLFGNGAYQRLYQNAKASTMAGVGYGGRVEIGPVHLGVAGHYGKGLGLNYALENSGTSFSQDGELRTFDGYSALAQVVAGSFDFNVGWGISRVFLLDSDRAAIAACGDAMGAGCSSVIKRQIGYAAVIVYHASPRLHYSIDYLRADYAWFLGEKQIVDIVNAGITVLW
jgi:hypothetical protein